MKILLPQETYCFKLLIKTYVIWVVFISSSALMAQDLLENKKNDFSLSKIKKEMMAAKNIGDSIHSYLRISDFFINHRPNIDSTILYANRAYVLSQKNLDSISAGRAKTNLAKAYKDLGEYHRATEEIDKAINLFRQIDDKEQLYFCLNILGIIQMRTGDLDLALKTYLKAVDYYKTQNNSEKLIVIYNNIGVIFMNLNDMKKAKSFLEHAIELCNELSNPELCEDTFQNLATVCRSEEDYENSIKYNNIALSIVANKNDLISTERIYSNMAYMYYLMKDLPKSIQYSQKSLNIFSRKQEDFNTIEANTYHTLGLIYLEQNDFKNAEKHLIIAHEVGTKLNYLANLPEFEFGLYTYYDQVGDYKKALSYYKDYVKAKEQLSGSEIRSSISEIEAAYLELRNEKEQKQLKLKQSKNTSTIVLLFTIFILAILIYFGFNIKKNRKKRQGLLEELERLKGIENASQVASSKAFELSREKIETVINRKVNETDWSVLNILLEDPVIPNKQIAERAFMSVDGIGSSLRRMYDYFDIKESKYKKISLLMEAIKISNSRN